MRTAEGLRVRPTSDRLRETLFNVLSGRIARSRFLDICAGSGAVGIEALSRGASHATFIDQSRRACSAIEANLEALGIHDAAILNRDAPAAIKKLREIEQEFDVVFFDPPYESQIHNQVMRVVGGLLAGEGIVVVEHRAKSPLLEEYGELRRYRELTQGESALDFYTRG